MCHNKRVLTYVAVHNNQPAKRAKIPGGINVKLRWYDVFYSEEVAEHLKEPVMSFPTLSLVQVVNES